MIPIDLSLIARASTPLLKPTVTWTHDKIIGKEILDKRELKETALQPILEEATEKVLDVIQEYDDPETHSICSFLVSPEAEQIIRQVYAASILDSKENNLNIIKREFLQAFSLYTEIDNSHLEQENIKIFEILVEGCEQVLTDAIDKGRLSAHEAKSNLRHRMVIDELRNIQRVVDCLDKQNQSTVQEILQFEKKYREQVANRHGFITPPFVDATKKISMDRIYVCPNFLPKNYSSRTGSEDLSITEFYSVLHRTVLLGDPGGGKSTFSQKLCYDLATQYEKRLLADRQVTPFLVILRDYASQKQQDPCSILEFINDNIKANYQITTFPNDAVEYLLLNGRAVIIFDGLDELTNTSDRQKIRDDVEDFANLYPSVPILVTSREVGYKEAPLNEERFNTFNLGSFNEKQVKDYAEKWFKVTTEETEEKRNKKVEAFLNESKEVPDLQKNPLMLGLMCNIYRGEGYIPRNRPEVYEECSKMLLKKWDKSRGIELPNDIQNIQSKIRPTIMYLANWIYSDSDQSSQGGVIEKKLINKASEYLLKRRFDDPDEAEDAAGEFVRFCRGRAWVFTDVGTNKNGDRLYNFTHRTFLEYFTACSLVRNSKSVESLFNILLPKIANQEWDMVCQLAFKVCDNNKEGAGDELLNNLVNEIKIAKDNLEKQGNSLDFAVRCLEFIVPSPKVTQKITKATIDYCITWGCLEKSNKDEYVKPENLLDNLSQANDENISSILDKSKLISIDYINNGDDYTKKLVLEILDYPYSNYFFNSKTLEILEDVELSYQERLFNLLRKYIIPYKSRYFSNKIVSVDDFIKWHGFEGLFQDYNYVLFPSYYTSSIAYYLVTIILNVSLREDTQKIQSILESLTEIILYRSKPICKLIKSSVFSSEFIFDSYKLYRDTDIYFNLIFGFSILIMIFMEWDTYVQLNSEEVIEGYPSIFSFLDFSEDEEENIPDILNYILYTFLARYEPQYIDKVQDELDNCEFTPEQQTLIWQWVKREIDFVEKPQNSEDSDFEEN
ncbi:MAG: NACHT domain-containing protein [Crocosphaera sp.]|nr:NACHT domain-containing protein [Crocosphaera sp.]